MRCCYCIAVAAIVTSLYFVFLTMTITENIDIIKCPYCYGETFCDKIKDVSVNFALTGIFVSLFNAKNVYFGEFENINVVAKKLASNSELASFDSVVCLKNYFKADCDIFTLNDSQNYTATVLDNLYDRSVLKPFKICTDTVADKIYEDILRLKPKDVDHATYMKNVWTVLNLNVEPLILQLLRAEDGWPFPKYYGSCGRLIVEEHRGLSILEHEISDWMSRANLAVQLLYAAKNLTDDHPIYRFYLTDISPDNIAVDDKLKLTFIDLENLIVQDKNYSGFVQVHKSEVIQDSEGFAFSEEDICSHSVSDHNYYAICKLILSKGAPYPMMKNGLLHSPPFNIVMKYGHLFDLVEDCAFAGDDERVSVANKIVDVLNEILNTQDKTTDQPVIISQES